MLKVDMTLLQRAIVLRKPYSPETIALISNPQLFQSWVRYDLHLERLYNHYYKRKTNERSNINNRHTMTMLELLGDAKKSNQNADVLSMARSMLARYTGTTRKQMQALASATPKVFQSLSSRDPEIRRIATLRESRLSDLIITTISKKWLIICGIDDFFNCKNKVKPRIDAPVSNSKMANVILMVIKVDGSAVPHSKAYLHDLRGCDALPLLLEFGKSEWEFNGTMTYFVSDDVVLKFFGVGFDLFTHFADHDTMNRHLRVHHYQTYNTKSEPRRLDGVVHLVEYLKDNSLKSHDEMADALNVLSCKLAPYLAQFASVLVGDFPVIRNSARLVHHGKVDALLKNLLIGMNPLHIGLNAQETVVNEFMPIFSTVNSGKY